MTPAWDVIGLVVSVIALVGVLTAAWYAFDQNEKEKKALAEVEKEYSDWKHQINHSPEIHPNWLDDNVSANPTESLSASPTISYSPEQEEEWTGSSGTTFVKTAKETFTGISGTHQFPIMKVPAKDEKCQWCGHRYPLVLNGIEVYYCPKCGGPRK